MLTFYLNKLLLYKCHEIFYDHVTEYPGFIWFNIRSGAGRLKLIHIDLKQKFH